MRPDDLDLSAISIHALREEGDPCGQCVVVVGVISIHALREEGDASASGSNLSQLVNFYPRPPRGGRRSKYYWCVSCQ